ncbi:MAG TPA: acyl-ACP--UDP-N-acetylglucosamine O-acyltransferase [Verrucomicrobiota bacterium]|nr:acyl-ACP--UDP-N-acetylglucosamine O-acyltransferase [Verrucomicrobiota bacterium]
MASSIHPSAIIHSGAEISDGCEIGPYCVIGERVRLGPGNRLHSHVVLDGNTTLGRENELFPFACLGGRTQDLKWRGGSARVEIGDHNSFREYVTVHSATEDGKATVIGSHNHLLAYTHIAHDCQLGNHIIASNVVQVAGHVVIEDQAVLAGMAAVHQFCRIGKLAMVAACTGVRQDIAPFMLVSGNPGETLKINKVGLERAGYDAETIRVLGQAYRILFRDGLSIPNALTKLETEFPASPELHHLIQFVRHSERGVTK